MDLRLYLGWTDAIYYFSIANFQLAYTTFTSVGACNISWAVALTQDLEKVSYISWFFSVQSGNIGAKIKFNYRSRELRQE